MLKLLELNGRPFYSSQISWETVNSLTIKVIFRKNSCCTATSIFFLFPLPQIGKWFLFILISNFYVLAGESAVILTVYMVAHIQRP